MTRKSANRRAIDAARAKANGGKAPSARVVREKTTRAWFELKTMHARTQSYVAQLAERMRQYGNPFVLMKIVKNGDGTRWNEVHAELKKKAATVAAELESLWELHKDKKKLCLSHTELEQAMRIADMYQAFDTDFYLTFSPLITELNQIFNKSLKDLLDAKAELEKSAAGNKAVDTAETVTDTPLPSGLKDLDMPVPANTASDDTTSVREPGSPSGHDFHMGPGGPQIPRDPNNVPTPVYVGDIPAAVSAAPDNKETLDDAGEDLVIDPNMRNGLIRPNL